MTIPVKRIAMWASPRCLSTVLLRSWSNRPDTFVHDEPLYPHYLIVSVSSGLNYTKYLF